MRQLLIHCNAKRWWPIVGNDSDGVKGLKSTTAAVGLPNDNVWEFALIAAVTAAQLCASNRPQQTGLPCRLNSYHVTSPPCVYATRQNNTLIIARDSRILLTWSGTVRLILNSRQTVVEIGENETVFTAAFVKQAKLILTQ